jgi:hypothetical protein
METILLILGIILLLSFITIGFLIKHLVNYKKDSENYMTLLRAGYKKSGGIKQWNGSYTAPDGWNCDSYSKSVERAELQLKIKELGLGDSGQALVAQVQSADDANNQEDKIVVEQWLAQPEKQI